MIDPNTNAAEAADEDELDDALSTIIGRLKKPDEQIRERMLPIWRYYDYLWRGYSTVFWNDTAKDYQIPTRNDCEILGIDYESLNHKVNVFRAYGESVIGALSSALPSVRFFPGDADNPADISTAKAFTEIDRLLDRQNDSPLLLVRILFTLWRQPFAAIYNHCEYSEEYGTRKEPVYEPQLVTEEAFACADCQAPVNPDTDVSEMGVACPSCGSANIAPFEQEVEQVVIVGYNDEPKSRVHLEVFGSSNVRVPYYARNQKGCIYLALETEEHIGFLQELYPEAEISGNSGDETYNKWARAPMETAGEVSTDTNTWGRWWIRPAGFNILGKDDERVALLKQKFPKGVKVCLVDKKIVSKHAESMDEHWSITMDPTSDHIHADPLGHPVVNIQEMTDEALDLEMQTLEHGVPQTFADPDVLDFKRYGESEVQVGAIYPAKAKAGQTLDNGFFTTKTATLSPEVQSVFSRLQGFGQLVSRAQPQIYGGKSGNETLGQDQQARQDALQRLSIVWKIVCGVWRGAKHKACMEYKNNLQEDERIVKSTGDSFINAWIRRSELTGEVSHVESEVSEQFPIGWAQQRDALLMLLGLNRPFIDAAVQHPENVSYIAGLFGLSKLYIPGEDDRNAQLRDIILLLQSEPLPPQPMLDEVGMPAMDPMMQPMMGQPQPTIPVDGLTANIPTRMETVRAWANSDAGQLAKIENPGGYANVMAQLQQMQMLLPPLMPVEEENNNGKGLSSPAKKDLSVEL